jgi:hypothetical protein
MCLSKDSTFCQAQLGSMTIPLYASLQNFVSVRAIFQVSLIKVLILFVKQILFLVFFLKLKNYAQPYQVYLDWENFVKYRLK